MGIVAAALVGVLVLAASSAPVRLWNLPPPGPTTATSVEPVVRGALPPPPSLPAPAPAAVDDTLLQILGIVVAVAAVLGVIALVRSWLASRTYGTVRRRWRRRWGRPRPGDVPVAEVTIDVDAARTALAEGHPRNAIVACWMQLERDVAAAGLPRRPAETSAEYVERVLAASSLDPRPIGELSALYREARFSRHELDGGHRGRAVAALQRVAEAIPAAIEAAP